MIGIALPYYSRAPLDTICLDHLSMVKALSMFALRRRGKTWFVCYELLPGAVNRGYRTLYVDLWLRSHDPDLAIVEALEAERPSARTKVTTTRLSAKLKAPFAEAGAEVERKAPAVAETTDLLGRLRRAMDALEPGGPWLLVIDEFQALAKCRTDGFVAALRAVLQARADVKLFLTGSSRAELHQMLISQRSPFLGMAMPIELPELGLGFVKDRCAFIRARTGRRIPAKAMMDIFERLLRVPEYLNHIVSLVIVEGHNAPDAFARWRVALGESQTAEHWRRLAAVDRGLLRYLVAEGGAGLFSRTALLAISLANGGTAVTSSQIQGVVRRLERARILGKGGTPGTWQIDDDAMRLFMEHFPDA